MGEVTKPEWLVPGAKVLIYSESAIGISHNVRRGEIAKVGKQTFTVADRDEPRFRIDGCYVHQGGIWGSTRHVVPLDSDIARKEIQGARRRNRISRADEAYDAWRRERNSEKLADLIAALNSCASLAVDNADVK